MIKKISAILFAFSLLLVTGCALDEKDASQTDIKEPKTGAKVIPDDYEARVPDSLTIYRNVDKHPTINKLCVEGIAFRTVSSTHSTGDSVVRVPEWDDTCPGYDPSRTQFGTNSGRISTNSGGDS